MVAGIGKVNPSTGPGSHSRGFSHKTVIITGITDDGRITCKDNFGKEVMVNAKVQRAKGLPPQVGERWMIDRSLGGWTLAACLDVPSTPPSPPPPSFDEFRLSFGSGGARVVFDSLSGLQATHNVTVTNTARTAGWPHTWECQYGGDYADIGVFVYQVADGNGIPTIPLMVMDWRTGPVSMSGPTQVPFTQLNTTDGVHVTANPVGDYYEPLFHLASHYLVQLVKWPQ